MAYSYIVDNTETQVDIGPIKKAIIQVNAALTGSIKVIDGISGNTANVATITDPAGGSRYEYNTLKTGFRVVASTSCNITAQTVPS